MWLDGLELATRDMNDAERGDLLNLMRDRDIHVRTDVYEILLASVTADPVQIPG